MIFAQFTNSHAQMGDTRTYQDFYKYLGARPHYLGVVSRLYPHLTASYLTESLGNIFYQDRKSKNRYQSINSLFFEWEIETNQIKRIPFAADVVDQGLNGCEITVQFQEKYYEKYDIFVIEGSRQQCQVVSHPIRKSDKCWEYQVRVVSNSYQETLNTDYCKMGDLTRFISNAVPELHEEGHVKYQSNVSRMRNYITTHRCDLSYSALYAAQEDQFIKIGEGKDQGSLSETIYRLDKMEKTLLENFLFVRNSGLLFNKSNIDEKTGKATIVDPDTNREIIIGDGMLPQVERFASKYAYGKLTLEVLNTVLHTMNDKAENPQGNNYLFICNEKFWNDLQMTLGDYLAKYHTDGAFMWSQRANKGTGAYVQVGSTYDSYVFGGNKIQFNVDRTFSREFGQDKGYALCLDLTADSTSNQPPIAMFSLKGADFITNKYVGVGGLDGISSGTVSSPVAGSKLIAWGYSGIAVFNPYRSFILREA